MKNTLIPLDIIWINADKKIEGITKNVQPCKQDPCQTYASPPKTKYVLEVNAGFSEKNGITNGMKADFE